ncbi:cbb3-type cytochrome c oxidase subunit I [Arthrobacter sp. NicSoilB8]|uniref:cbb3-type cytochrome c oxidase subunit I n=1 Tax=Arthrobacter sp. NicSoilB8 TaxID=2830998 RepID=UPI001CC4F3AF|nr:cbb3-type cytochrome c oxidase subunit I [Arthrobacter sp. NicSoilB8]BCW72710.1 hypothetical protein NicSoilB8_37540 [Arthrobacter sp. NicSoilB8]
MDPRGNRDAGRARKRQPGRLAAPLVAAAMLLAGLIFLSQPVPPEDFGWFAYAPLASPPVILHGLIFMGAEAWAGVALIGVGLLTLAFWTGYRTGRQARNRREDAG